MTVGNDSQWKSFQLVCKVLFVISVVVVDVVQAFSPVKRTRAPRVEFMASKRVLNTDRPFIEDVLDLYSDVPNLTSLALGSSYWSPPEEALNVIKSDITERMNHRYGNILGYTPLRQALGNIIEKQGVDMSEMEVTITAGANQGFLNLAMLLCDADDDVVVIAPYYFSHLLSFQLCQAKVNICSFDPLTLEPNWDMLAEIVHERKPKMVVITTPNNPSGYVWSESNIRRIVTLCKKHSSWLAVDQTYHEFLYENTKHIYPCGKAFDYDKIVHIFSLSKIFGMAGWRVGYVVYPSVLSEHMRKIQDTSITHAAIFSQKLAHACLVSTYDDTWTQSSPQFSDHLTNRWIDGYRQTLARVREALWPIVAPLGTVKPMGAFYFLVPLPFGITEEEAVDILAKRFGVLLMLGKSFGCPNHLRLSYGSIPPEQVLSVLTSIRNGFDYLQQLSADRQDGHT